MRAIKLEQEEETKRKTFLGLEKRELAYMVEMGNLRIRQLELSEERARNDIRDVFHRCDARVDVAEGRREELEDRIRDTICEMIQGAADRCAKGADYKEAMYLVRAIEHMEYNFPEQAQAILSRRMDFQRAVGMAWVYLCRKAKYVPRPGNPLATLYENVQALEQSHGDAIWDAYTDWAG